MIQEYLLLFNDPPIYHVSISSSTIMLGENFTAKVILFPSGYPPYFVKPSSPVKNNDTVPCLSSLMSVFLALLVIVLKRQTKHAQKVTNYY